MITEQQWLADADYPDMLECVVGFGLVTERKERLFNIACCRRIWPLLRKDAAREAILVAERYVDGEADRDDLRAALRVIQAARSGALIHSPSGSAYHAAGFVAAQLTPPYHFAAADQSLSALLATARPEEYAEVRERGARTHRDLLREFFGNPFRPVAIDAGWLSPSVVALARGIYADHAFDAMPILADALEDAGCADAAVLDHCRGAGPHYRGCWVLDLLLGKQRASLTASPTPTAPRTPPATPPSPPRPCS